MVEFKVHTAPQGKARARTVKNKYTGKTMSFTPQKTVDYENLIRWSYKAAAGNTFFEGHIGINIVAMFEIPKSFSRKRREMAIHDDVRPTNKPDVDNIAKAVLDALNGVAYGDDKQVVSLSVKKFYCEKPAVYISVYKMDINKENEK